MGHKEDKKTAAVIEEIQQVVEKIGNFKNWTTLADALNKEGILSSRGAKWHGSMLQSLCKRHKVVLPRKTEVPEGLTQPETPEIDKSVHTGPTGEEPDEQDLLADQATPPEREHGKVLDTSTEDVDSESTKSTPENASGADESKALEQALGGTPTEIFINQAPEITQESELPQPTNTLPGLDAETVAVLKEMVAWWKLRDEDRGPVEMTLTERKTWPLRTDLPGDKKNTGIFVNERLLRAVQRKLKRPEERPWSGGRLSSLLEYLMWAYMNYDPRFQQ